MSKFTLNIQRGPVELAPERILCNHVMLPHDTFNPHNVRLWVIGNEYGALGAVWADCVQDALDELVDSGLGAALLVDDADFAKMEEAEREGLAQLGNAGEYADLQHAWIYPVIFDPAKDCPLMCAFAEARGASASTLDDI